MFRVQFRTDASQTNRARQDGEGDGPPELDSPVLWKTGSPLTGGGIVGSVQFLTAPRFPGAGLFKHIVASRFGAFRFGGTSRDQSAPGQKK